MKTRTLIFSLASILLLALTTCKKDPQPIMERFDLSREDLTVGTTSASIVGTYAYSGAINEITVCVSEDGVHPATFAADINGKNFAVEMTGLRPATSYQYYYSVDYGFTKPFTTEAKTFTTLSESPTVRTIDVISIDSTTVRVNCETVSDGGVEITERGVCWNTYGNPNLDDECLTYASAGLGQYSCRISGLALSTKYYVRAYAKNASGIGFGEVLEFKTLAEALLPEVSTVEVGNVTSTTATCMGNVASDGGLELTERGVCWSLSSNPTTNGNHAAASDATLGVFEISMTGLTPNKTYHARAYATNAKGTAYGDDLTFTTTEGLPVVTTSGITEITATSAKGGGEVTDQGASNVTERGICWGTSHNPTTAGTHASNGTGAGSYTVSMINLTPNATYYVRAYATNAQGTAYGAEVSFTALEGLPVVLTLDMTDITSTTAKGHGKVTDQGGSAVTERGVCWSTSPSPTTSGSHAQSGTGTGEYTVSISNLTPGTRYYVRAYATNSQGTTYGEQKDFTTAATLPTVVTGDISGTTAHGEVTNAGGAIVTERGICWGTSHNPTTAGTHGSSGTGTGNFSVELTDLAPGTTYYVRAYATNSAGTAYGSEKTLTTQATLPTVTTGEVSNITQTTAQGSGNVTNTGGANVTERGVCWSTSHNPTISGSHAYNGTGTGSYTVNMTGLTANTHYYVRAYAKNSAGVSYGNEVDFTTSQNISAPTVTTSQVTNITQTTATGGGNVTNSGGATVTERGICWSTSHNPTTSGSHANSGTGTGSFTVNMTGLTPNTTYYVRAYAINSAGTSYGSEVSFTTQQIPSYTISVSANPTGGGSITGGGTYQQGQSCTVSATAATGYTFLRWTENGTQVSTNANYTFTVSGNRTLVAQFQANSYTVSVSANPTNGGSVTGGGTYNYGQSCTVTATANTNYAFTNWTEGGSQVSTNANYTFTVTGNRTLVANFTLQASMPTVTTTQVTNITQTTATGGGNVTSDGGASVTARGVCWSTSHNPTVSGSHTTNGTGTGSFTSSITGLTANTTYYVRAYATNSVGTAYGSEVSFTTQPSYPVGAINGLFTINANGDQVYFSQGNLQYQASTNTWKFADNQYDYVGSNNSNISSTYSGWIDLFGWGTSGYHNPSDPYNVNYQPWSISASQVNSSYNYYGYGPSTNMTDPTLTGTSANYDWGVYNPISNGGNTANQWRTLTQSEWNYVFNTRTTTSGIRYAKANVNNVNGVILLPDDWSSSTYSLSNTNSSGASFSSNTITAAQWTALEDAGVVFLPAAGNRDGTSVGNVGSDGYYWSASCSGSSQAGGVYFSDSYLYMSVPNRYYGFSVRLVRVAEN